jgi:hypothetical protein
MPLKVLVYLTKGEIAFQSEPEHFFYDRASVGIEGIRRANIKQTNQG